MFYPSRGLKVVAAAVLWATVLGPAASADTVFSYGMHTYEIVTEPKTWVEAAADATGRTFLGSPGALVQIDDQAENDVLIGQLLAAIPPTDFGNTDTDAEGGYGAFVWIGATDRGTEGAWLWDADNEGQGDQFWQGTDTGNPVGGLFNAWGAEPDDFGSSQDAAAICLNAWPNVPGNPIHGQNGGAGQWNDLDETNRLYYVVEFALVPEPSTFSLLCCGGICCLVVLALGRRRR